MTQESVQAAPAKRLKSRALAGTAISLLSKGASQGLRLVGNMILSRLLVPEAFGLMAIVRMVMNGLEMMSNVGLQPSIIQHQRGDDQRFLDTAWSIQILRGILLWLIGVALAIPLAVVYEQEELRYLIPAATVCALLNGLQSTKIITLTRHISLGRVAFIELAGQISALAAMIWVGFIYHSVWALVIGALVAAGMRMLLTHFAIPGAQNRPRWDREAARDIFSFGKWIFVSTLLTFVALRMDVMLLGKLLPMDVLGVYYIGIMISALPREVSSRIIQSVLMPVLAESQRESQDVLAERFERTMRVALPAGMIALLALVFGGPAFFYFLYDERYHGAGWIAQLSMATLWFSYLQESTSRALLAVGDSRSLAVANMVKTVTSLAGCVVGFWLGGLAGLMVGVTFGAFCAYLTVALSLRARGLPGLAQGLKFSAIGLSVGSVFAGGLYLVADRLPEDPASLPVATLAVGAVILAPMALWAYRLLRSETRRR